MLEFDLIAHIRKRAVARSDVLLGIGDDCALLLPPIGKQLAVTMDTLNAGVHFPPETAPFDIGWKALAVNLSDLAAMGAQPAWCTLSLSLPASDEAFVAGFLDGFFALAKLHDMDLVGGDTTQGPLSISITAHGIVEPGHGLRRDGARVGDDVWVSGSLGDAAGALEHWRNGSPALPELRQRLDRPTPRVGLGLGLRGIASACIDISDGLLADLGHLCRASAVAATIGLDALPTSPALHAAFPEAARQAMQATGGDDYELCFTAPPQAQAALLALAQVNAVQVTRIGSICAGDGVRAMTTDGGDWQPPHRGFEHFR